MWSSLCSRDTDGAQKLSYRRHLSDGSSRPEYDCFVPLLPGHCMGHSIGPAYPHHLPRITKLINFSCTAADADQELSRLLQHHSHVSKREAVHFDPRSPCLLPEMRERDSHSCITVTDYENFRAFFPPDCARQPCMPSTRFGQAAYACVKGCRKRDG